MTGRDLIIYILQNGLEDRNVDTIMSKYFIGEEEVAKKFGVGVETIKTWYILHLINGFMVGNELYLPSTITDPRKG